MSISSKFYEAVETILRADPRFVSDDDTIMRERVREAANALDPALISLLLANEATRDRFFVEVDGVQVFDKREFGWVVSNREFLPDSYTRFKNKIGLTDSRGEFISSSDDVVLAWPYKDCVLEGGQTKEDQKRAEVFYNTTLAPDERDRLLAPKVFTGAKRYRADGVEEGIEFRDDDNLIIKGNNLLVISSLLKRFEGQVKCIYVDLPFNTGSDGFNYNDSFNHSTWLTFIKNRLELAKRLLSEDGSIFVHCDENENGYLRVLCDEVLGRENLMNEIIWRYRTYVGNVKEYFPKKHDTIFWYKNKVRPAFNLIYEDNVEETVDFKRWQNYLVDGYKIQYGSHPTTDSRFTAYLKKFVKQYGTPADGDVIYEVRGYVVDDVWEDIIALDPKNLTERTKFTGGQKPEALLERIIQSVTTEGDLVLDFFLGSGTTCAVAHKLNRRYIGIEQMDYLEEITRDRLCNVLAGDSGGISESVGWTGAGSFVYCELADLNSAYVKGVRDATNDGQLEALLASVLDTGFVSARLDPAKYDVAATEFTDLSFADKRQFITDLLDMNMLYVNYSDIDDEDYEISRTDKAFTRSLYAKDA
ncbi:MAG: site-specific DNA-methyltransferase [Cellulomonadaceae bacterium]|jgi:adenine-specific DNA-methyltransferase|nr:site-specific DNA-methyltransferase [Cellulomonadaceae bacterium]